MKIQWFQHLRVVGSLILIGLVWLKPANGKSEADSPKPSEIPSTAESQATRSWSQKVKSFLEQDYLLGDWGGTRTALSKHGVDFEFFYLGAVPSNLSGGLKGGSVYEGGLLMTLDLDSQKLAGYEGGHFHAGSLWIHNGREFSANFVGDLNKVSLIDFPDSFRLWELWYEQKFFDGKVSLKLGQLAIDRDFIVPEYYNSLASINFLNQTFFYPTLAFNVYDIQGFPPGNHALASTPYSAPGVRLRWDPTERYYAQAAVYGGNPDRSHSGTHFNLSEDEGALAYFEIGYRRNQGKADEGLPGNFKLGSYFHTDDFLDVYDGATGVIAGALGLPADQPRSHPNNYGVYFLAEQMLYREQRKEDPASQGLVGFFRVAGAPKDRNLTQFGIDGGLVYKGLIPGRDYDSIGIAASYLEISNDIRRAQRDANSAYGEFGLNLPLADYETVFEFSYKAQVTAWWTLQPSIQWVLHPGGRTTSTAIPDAVVFIIQTTVRF
jgi:porin